MYEQPKEMLSQWLAGVQCGTRQMFNILVHDQNTPSNSPLL